MDIWAAFWRGFMNRIARPHGRGDSDDTTREPIIKEPPMEIDGRVMTADEFVRYVEGLDFPPPLPTRIFLHHTWRPTQAEWDGHNTIMAMKSVYETRQWRDSEGRLHEGWTAGPHLFVAEDGIWLFSDLRWDGVGVYGHNYRSRHLEMVGDYDNQRPSGATLQNTIAALGILHAKLGLDIRNLNFHRDFAGNTCPGKAVEKSWLIPLVAEWIANYQKGEQDKLPMLRQTLRKMIEELLVATNPNAALAKAADVRGLVGALTNEVPIEVDDQAYIVQFFAEALIVPVGQWDKVKSLKEFEQASKGLGEPAAARRKTVAPPKDPYGFEGKIR